MHVSTQKMSWSAAALVISLTACNIAGDAAPPQPAQTDGEPATGARSQALVLGHASSPVINELDDEVSLIPYNGSQDVADYELIVFDGDAHTPETVEEHEVIREALRLEKWVLGVDLSEAHKKEGLGSSIGFTSGDTSGAYMVNARPNEQGRTVYRIIGDAPPEAFSHSSAGAAKEPSEPPHPNAAAYAEVVTKVLTEGDTLAPTGGLQAQNAPSPDDPIPQELKYQQWIYSYVGDGSITNSNKASGTQRFSFLVNYTFTVFLDNGNPQGDFQYVLVQIDGQANPTAGNGNFLRMDSYEKAWFQDRVHLEFNPDDDSAFEWVANDPQTPNGEATYTADSGFDVGFEGKAGTATYHWGSSKEYTVSDWKVSSNGSENDMSWDFRSGSPDSDKPYDSCEWVNCGAFGTDFPKDPNALSKGQLQFHASVVYRTTSLIDTWTTFEGSGFLNLVDLYCPNDFGAVCAPQYGGWQTKPQNFSKNFSIDMGAVAATPIRSIGFNQNPATAGASVTGTVYLDTSVETDIVVKLKSSSANAKVPSSVTVPEGKRVANFQVQTSADGIDTGESTTATITASYGGDFPVQLTVKNYAENDLKPPTTAPRLDETKYAQCASDAGKGKWSSGYAVRYAASFVGADGKESDRGPWTGWTSHSPYMLPNLQDVPTDPSGAATARKVYRQFFADFYKGDYNPSAGISLTGTLDDNTTTELQDEDTAGTPIEQCPK